MTLFVRKRAEEVPGRVHQLLRNRSARVALAGNLLPLLRVRDVERTRTQDLERVRVGLQLGVRQSDRSDGTSGAGVAQTFRQDVARVVVGLIQGVPVPVNIYMRAEFEEREVDKENKGDRGTISMRREAILRYRPEINLVT